ncbi:hypothetical protein BH10ACT11_BH10ACT11_16430 [soil metagenome]
MEGGAKKEEEETVSCPPPDTPATRLSHQGETIPFGELTAEQAAQRAAELKEAGEWGPLKRTLPVRMAWTDIAALLRDRDLATIGELPDGEVAKWAERTWVLSPPGGLI